MESSDSSIEKSRENEPLIEKESYTDIMMKRWQKHLEKTLDKKDLDDAGKVNNDNGQAEYA